VQTYVVQVIEQSGILRGANTLAEHKQLRHTTDGDW
jgi:hypothetical protein